MTRRYSVEDWRKAVFRDPHISDATRVLLLLLAEDMRDSDLKVSVKRSSLAKRLGRSERRIAERFREAVGEAPGQDKNKRLLDRVVRGQKNHAQSVYQGLMPDRVNMTPVGHVENSLHDGTEHVENAGDRHEEKAQARSLHDPRGSRLTRDQPSRVGTDPKRSYEDQAPTPAGDQPAVCESETETCPHGKPGGHLPDTWFTPPRISCSECAAANRKEGTQP